VRCLNSACALVVSVVWLVACVAPEDSNADEPLVAETTQAASVATTYDTSVCGNTNGYQPNAAWPAFGACPTGRRSSPQHATTSGFVNFQTTLGGMVQSAPAIAADGTVYVGSNDGKLNAVNRDGTIKWQKSLLGSVHSSPAIGADGTLYVGADLGGFYALNPADGSTKWSFSSAFPIRSSPVIGGADGTIYFAGGGGLNLLRNFLYGVFKSGAQRFSLSLSSAVSSAPAIGPEGHVYVATDGTLLSAKTLYAVDPFAGVALFQVSVGGTSTSGPAVAPDGTIYVGSGQKSLKAFRADGSSKWTYAVACGALVDCSISATPAIGPDGSVYVGTNDGRMLAVSANGTKRWDVALGGGRIESSAAVDADGHIYVGTNGNRFFGLNRADGSQLFSITTGGAVHGSPAINDYGTIFFGTDGNRLFSVGERYTGFVRGTAKTPIGDCNNNQLAPNSTTSVCLATPPTGAARVDVYVNGKLTTTTNNCVNVTAADPLEVRSFEFDASGAPLGSHFALLTTTARAKHCPIFDHMLLGGLGDDVLVGTSGDDYISSGPGVDYLVPRGGNDVVVPGSDPDTVDLTGFASASALGTLRIVGADLTQDKVLTDFAPSTLPQSVFSPAAACNATACSSVPTTFEKVYTELADPAPEHEQPLWAVRQIHDIGGGYVVTGTGVVAKLAPSGAVQWQTRAALGGQDVEEYYDAAGKRRGYIIVGSPDGIPNNLAFGYAQILDLQGNQIAYNEFDGRFEDQNGNFNGFAVSNRAYAVRATKDFIMVAGYTDAAGATAMPNGTFKYQSSGKAYVLVFANHIANGKLDRLITAEGFASDAPDNKPGNAAFQAIELIPPSGTTTAWRVALSGYSHVGLRSSVGLGDGLQSSFAVIAELGSGITGGSGSTRVKPLAILDELGDIYLGGFPGAANVPGVGVLFAGSSDFGKINSPFPIAATLDSMDYDLNFKFDTDPERGAFFPVANEFYSLGGYTETRADKVRLLEDGGFMVVGSTQDAWDASLLTTPRDPSERIDFDFAVHGLLVRTNSAALSRTYKSFGHPSAGHIVNTLLKDGWPTTDRGFVAAGLACPGPAHPCGMIPYVVKTKPDMTSQGLSCSCDNGYEDCGEAAHGFRTQASIRPGDCGGTSSCGACAIDCTNGVQDADEEGPDCGGPCALERYSPNPHDCACSAGDCVQGPECTTPICDPQFGCQNRPVADGTDCSAGKCQGGTCVSRCVPSNCDDGNECTADVCDPHTGCQHSDVADNTACSGGVCTNGTCTAACSGTTCDDDNPCTTDGCNPSDGQCTATAVPNGTLCDGGVCLSGICSTPNYVSNVYPILQNYCSSCHGGPIGTCSGSTCLAQCYAEATKNISNCVHDPAQTNAHDCLTSYVKSGFMPANGSNCSPTNRGPGCPTERDINVIETWNANHFPATGDQSAPPACQTL
jgi:outer membrane protein assembly factor BamB